MTYVGDRNILFDYLHTFVVNPINGSSLSKELSSDYYGNIVKSSTIRAKLFIKESVNDQNLDILNYVKNVNIYLIRNYDHDT